MVDLHILSMRLVQVEGVIHFENDIEELQQWDHQVTLALLLSDCCLNVFLTESE